MSLKSVIIKLISRLGYKISKNAPAVSIKEIDFEITYLDIGSSGGLPPKWERYVKEDFFKFILVEPDTQEVELLKNRYPKALIIPCAFGSKEQNAVLNVTYAQACSSILIPDEIVLKRFPVKKWFEVVKKINVNIIPFTSLKNKYSFSNPDFVKMDVQGYESEILEGFGDYLDSILCIELETHLIPVYKNQKTLEAINKLLMEKGFFLRHLQRTGIFEDEVVEFDAYFIKMPHLLKSEVELKKIDFWCKLNELPKGTYFKNWDII